MAFKDLLVILDQSQHCAARIEAAVGLALRCEAELTGLYLMPSFAVSPFLADQFSAESLEATQAGAAQQRDETQALFDAATRENHVAATWCEERGDATELGLAYARLTDLAILGQDDPTETSSNTASPDRLVIESGRPAVIIPFSGTFPHFGRRILVGWNGSREAVRAINDALPLLRTAEQVTLLTIGPDTSASAEGIASGIAAHLRRHGVKPTLRQEPSASIGAANALLASAADEGTDLIVMGLYGHSRLRELAFGGVTREMLAHMTAPLFVSH